MTWKFFDKKKRNLNGDFSLFHPLSHTISKPKMNHVRVLSTTWTWKFFEKKREISKLIEKSLRQINDHLRWVSTNRNVRIALSFTTLGSIKVVYSWFESVAQHHIFTQLITLRIETLKILCFGIKCIYASFMHNRPNKSSLLGGILT